MAYSKDQCWICGGIRVANSNMCADCLVNALRNDNILLDRERIKVKELQEKLTRAIEIGAKLIDTIAENQRYIEELRAEKCKVILSLN